MYEFKEIYVERYKKLLGDEWPIFKEAILTPFRSAFRINTLKSPREDILKILKKKDWKIKNVGFYDDGFVFTEKRDFVLGNTIEHFLGYIYIQETASMLPPVLLDPQPHETILDVAASPGSKTTQIATMMQNTGLIVANEKDFKRITPLRMNLQRCGILNTVVTNMDGRRFKDFKIKFDRVLVDAPCTGSGIIMKSIHTIKTWSVKASEIMSGIQKQLLQSAAAVVKPGGIIVYSTCSLEPEEDEENINYAVKKLGLIVEPVKVKNFKTRPGITEWNGKQYDPSVANALRIYPQDNQTQGFFCAKLRKP